MQTTPASEKMHRSFGGTIKSLMKCTAKAIMSVQVIRVRGSKHCTIQTKTKGLERKWAAMCQSHDRGEVTPFCGEET